MNIYLHLKVVGAMLLALGLAHSMFGRYFKWRKELAQLSLLTRQIFLVHCFFIALLVVMIGVCSLFCTSALLGSGALSRVVLTGFVLFWLFRLGFQLFVYDPAIWRGQRFYTVMHVAFSIFWIYVVLIYGAALRMTWKGWCQRLAPPDSLQRQRQPSRIPTLAHFTPPPTAPFPPLLARAVSSHSRAN